MNDTATTPSAVGIPDLESWWADLEASLTARGLAIFPLSEWPSRGVLEWPEDRTVEAFLAVAELVGVRLLYALPTHLSQEMADRVGFEDATQHIGRLAYVALFWVHQGIRHGATAYADW